MHVSPTRDVARRLPIGAEPIAANEVHFRVWAPKRRRVEVAIAKVDQATRKSKAGDFRFVELESEAGGYFSGSVEQVPIGARYGYRLDGDSPIFPDPASRFQPQGPAELSQVVDGHAFKWTDAAWKGVGPLGQVIYEMHIGTFTPEGTWAAASRELAELKSAGITLLEVMPVADFAGEWGWGYDGVSMFAPTRLYGEPDDFRRFVDQAHALGLGVILDVVYNHLGNFQNYVGEYTDHFYTTKYRNEWAAAIAFEGEAAQPVREFFLANARYWIDEFHLDGYRFDATQSVFDASPCHILGAATEAAKQAAGERSLFFCAENEPQDMRQVRTVEAGGNGMHALWNDDFHHAAMVRLTGKNPAYYSDYLGTAYEFAAAVKRGFLYQGQRSRWQEAPRGTPTTGFPAISFITFLQNHDQVANSGDGERVHKATSPGRYRAMTALWLLAPQTPLFFQGQEFCASTPFFYFCDFPGDSGKQVKVGRAKFLEQFPDLATAEAQALLVDPNDPAVYERCKLNLAERATNVHQYDLHKDLLKLRREEPVFARQRADLLECAVLNHECFLIRYFNDGDDRLVLVNFGCELHLAPGPEPLLAPPADKGWALQWSSESPRYGGGSTHPLETDQGWSIPGEATVVLRASHEKSKPVKAHTGAAPKEG
ncbi:MAG: malto-oligosyltrehalose trehalohydrolase [Planctomycetia bacterium]|nr:malto-oligosyltrehalose trehalohydrolase [Planctomycetia bacterium]